MTEAQKLNILRQEAEAHLRDEQEKYEEDLHEKQKKKEEEIKKKEGTEALKKPNKPSFQKNINEGKGLKTSEQPPMKKSKFSQEAECSISEGDEKWLGDLQTVQKDSKKKAGMTRKIMNKHKVIQRDYTQPDGMRFKVNLGYYHFDFNQYFSRF